jgi:hypothetical protein
MKRIRIVGLAIVAIVAFSVVATGAASAAKPNFTVFPNKFSSKGGKAELKSGSEIVSCTSSENKGGEVTGEKTAAKVTVKFAGCEKGGKKCSSGTLEAGKINTKVLSGEIGYVGTEKNKVGLKLKPTTGEEFVNFKCEGGFETKVQGCVIGEAKPLNVLQTTGTLSFRESGGKQEFTGFEGGTGCELLAFGFAKSVEVAESTITFEKAEEIEA